MKIKKLKYLYIKLFFIIIIIFIFNNPVETEVFHSGELRSGWYQRDPYQYNIIRNEKLIITGLDIEIANLLFHKEKYRITFEKMTWSQLLEGLKNGTIDFVMGAYYEKDRVKFAHYSIPYRVEHNSIYYNNDIKSFKKLKNVDDFIKLLNEENLTIAITKDMAYGSETYEEIIYNPPPNIKIIQALGYKEKLNLLIDRKVDLFLANPIMMDRLLAESLFANHIEKIPFSIAEIPVHILFSKKTVSENQVQKFNKALESLKDNGDINSLQIDFLLPIYLGIATGQTWFIWLNILGIVAFCTSAVLLARKERYNLFGALVLATLPAIGGGVIRDIFLGVEEVFVLKTPEYLLVAIGVVFFSFLCFKIYDYFYSKSQNNRERFIKYTEIKDTTLIDKLFKFFDAWAVASFTIVGVSIAIEMKTEYLWLWGPAMGVLTASGGVVLRDIVRADFNIEMLKQDSYAEISILGGFIYTAMLLFMPIEISINNIFYMTMIIIVILFAFRFFILCKGYSNPFQFGALHTRPEINLQKFKNNEPQLWKLLTYCYNENEIGKAQPVSTSKLEEIHTEYLYIFAELKAILDKVAAEPLNNLTLKKYLESNSILEIINNVENTLYSFIENMNDLKNNTSNKALELQQNINESIKTILETAYTTIESNDLTEFLMLQKITANQKERFKSLRKKYSLQEDSKKNIYFGIILDSTYKIERIIYLISEYINIYTGQKDFEIGNASNRRTHKLFIQNKKRE